MTATSIEEGVLRLWHAGPYQGHGLCVECGAAAYCCGVNTVSRICVICFEFVFGCKHPNLRRRKTK